MDILLWAIDIPLAFVGNGIHPRLFALVSVLQFGSLILFFFHHLHFSDINKKTIISESQCPEIAKPDHSLVVPKYDGAILMYFCESGYKLVGSAEIYCDGRQWNGTAPYCRGILFFS